MSENNIEENCTSKTVESTSQVATDWAKNYINYEFSPNYRRPSQVFEVPGVEFLGVHPDLRKYRCVTVSLWLGTFTVLGVVVSILFWIFSNELAPKLLFTILTLLLAILWAWQMWLIPRQVRALGFGEGQTDLLIRQGVMLRRLRVIPYGRIQNVTVSQGPIMRKYKLAEVKVATAALGADMVIPGLTYEQAHRLRAHLMTLGEQYIAGI